jgi:hypothetical protein
MTAVQQSVTPGEAMVALDGIARELDDLSGSLAGVERQLEPVESEYERFMASHEIGLWQAHIDHDAKLPPAGLRERLAHRDMPSELYGRHTALNASRKRMEKRIGVLKAASDAQRSILSALKVELEAGR